MAAHSELDDLMRRRGLAVFSAGAGVTTVAAGSTTLSQQDIRDLMNAANAEGHELIFTAGALKVRPKDSAL